MTFSNIPFADNDTHEALHQIVIGRFGEDRPAHHADTRAMNDDDIMSATRGLQMGQLHVRDLRDLIHEHAGRDAFASAVIVVAAARRMWLTGHMDLTTMLSWELAAIFRDPALVARQEVIREIDRRTAEVDAAMRHAIAVTESLL